MRENLIRPCLSWYATLLQQTVIVMDYIARADSCSILEHHATESGLLYSMVVHVLVQEVSHRVLDLHVT